MTVSKHCSLVYKSLEIKVSKNISLLDFFAQSDESSKLESSIKRITFQCITLIFTARLSIIVKAKNLEKYFLA